jgi:2-oxoglutarate ferredoxin oxidoreductase subunit alpha
MSTPTNDFVITVATSNGSGSQSSNNILVRTLFRMGLPVGGKNLFPSNIQGLPTWFTIRVNPHGFTARKKLADIVVAMNAATAVEDFKLVRPGGVILLNSDLKISMDPVPQDVVILAVPFKSIVDSVTDSVKLKKLLINMIYVGVLAELLQIPQDILDAVMDHQFSDKAAVLLSNRQAVQAGRDYARENLAISSFPFRMEPPKQKHADHVLMDGNTAAAMGLVFGGCTIVTWYPITPSSSVVEHFSELAGKYRTDGNGHRDFAVLQAEDELAAIAMVVGAGWAGARACTATSGPGLSLMSEAAGLSYYAEIPAVIWDVQRVGPSTGLPTRTMQGDLLSAYYLSHGDCKHVVLLPGNPEECFEFGQMAFDLAERLQTLVLVLSDLDLGMNLRIAKRFEYPERPMDRGKVLTAEDLEKLGRFQRYKDMDGDGIPYRTLTGTSHPQAAYFTRGTGHDESGFYSENPDIYKNNMIRLSQKFETARKLVPPPVVSLEANAEIGLLYFGSTEEAALEAAYMLGARSKTVSRMRLRALPLSAEVTEFIQSHKRVYVIEQNRDAQLMAILRAEKPEFWNRCFSVLHFDGMPIDAEEIFTHVMKMEGQL